MQGSRSALLSVRSRLLAFSVLLASTMASIEIKFDMQMPIADRVTAVAPIINKMIDSFDSADSTVGVEAFQDDLQSRIRAAGLMEKKWLSIDTVGVHPDNREGAMIVPIDMHDLLKRLAKDGWNYSRWEALACEIPANPIGQAWRKANEDLAKGCDGLLAPCQGDALTVLTGRGSHGTAALRAMQFGSKGIHPEVCAGGNVSKSKIIESQPSLEQPLLKGCPYDIIKAELVIACPRLMETLSRTGNAGHSVFRVQTTLQHCNRIHQLAMSRQSSNQAVDWEVIAKHACIGMDDDFLEDAKKLTEFVRIWSGGEDCFILKDLELYERTLRVKRKLYAHDLQALSKIDFTDGQKYIPAMVKALLTAPIADSTGHAILFTNSDYSSLQLNGKARPFAKDANTMMESAYSFLTAYGRFEPNVLAKLLSEFEVRCVMHVHQKRCETRASFKSLQHIAKTLYTDAKMIDERLPAWNKLEPLEVEEKPKMAPKVLREIRKDGSVADSEMKARGFMVGANVMKKSGTTILKIMAMDSPKVVTLEDDEGAVETIDRHEMISLWAVHVVEQEETFKFGEYTDPSTCSDMLVDVWKGHIKAMLIEAYKKSSEPNIIVHSKPSLKVEAGRSFKEGALTLVGLTNNISITNKSSHDMVLAECFEHPSHGTMRACANRHLQFPIKVAATGFARPHTDPFIVAYWACQETLDTSKANCQASLVLSSLKIGSSSYKAFIPTITNTKALQSGDEIIVLKASIAEEPQPVEPEAKRHKGAQGSHGKKGKGKGKGKSSK